LDWSTSIGQSSTHIYLDTQLTYRALESILVATSNALEEEMGYTRNLVRDLLADLEDDINRDNLKRLLHYSRRMAGFQSRARYVKRAVDEVLESGMFESMYKAGD
jgi:hypothetical protein